ncbi:MAG: UDP-N-acetylmuramate dehydrogenase [Acidobacteria bacterium]|nr:UDP-N-acetylmuramate dehydrogenase [Acidobacteriota bacterium]
MQVRENIPLAPLATLGVGGPARYFAEAAGSADVQAAIRWAGQRNVRLFVLGGGSNLVISDAGFPGLVLRIAIPGMDDRRENGSLILQAGAGVEWDAAVARAVELGAAGVECLSGIPGTVGGTPVQNVGAYGQEVSDTICEVEAVDRETGEVSSFCAAACQFAYRSSIFNTVARERYVIVRVSFALEPGGAPAIRYADLKRYFSEHGPAQPSLADARCAVREIRRAKAMLICEGEEDCRSAGSFFKNPIVTSAENQRLADLAARAGATIPSFHTAEGLKVSAAWLVEHSGFQKGYARGAVGISRRHALAIVNRGGATAADVIVLKDEIQRGVRDAWGVELVPEPVFVGF